MSLSCVVQCPLPCLKLRIAHNLVILAKFRADRYSKVIPVFNSMPKVNVDQVLISLNCFLGSDSLETERICEKE